MSGHSKWATIKHKKGKEDAKRGRVFTKLIRELSVAARMGGSDPDSNPRLRQTILAAKAANMPNDNIERAIKKGAGELEGVSYEEITFEGYGPAGVAMLVNVMTDNRNRTVAEVRHLLERHNGKMGESGCVSWMFDNRGVIYVEKQAADEDKVTEIALDSGADDVREEGDYWKIVTMPPDFEAVKNAFDGKGIPNTGEITMIPQTEVQLTGKDASAMMKLIDSLDDHDDVQHVYANYDISDEEMEKLSA